MRYSRFYPNELCITPQEDLTSLSGPHHMNIFMTQCTARDGQETGVAPAPHPHSQRHPFALTPPEASVSPTSGKEPSQKAQES